MKQSALSLALFYAACGFAGSAAVLLTPTLHADGPDAPPVPKTSVSTANFDLAVRYNEDTAGPEVYATNTTDRPERVRWIVRVQSTGPISPMSRVPAMMKDVSSEPGTVVLAPHESRAVAIDIPAAKANESRAVLVDVVGKSLIVPMQAVHPAVSAVSDAKSPTKG